MSDILCPDCGHDIGDHWESGEDVDPGCDRGHGRPADGSPRPCRYSPTYIYRALLAERDARIALVRQLHQRIVIAVHESGVEEICPSCDVDWPCATAHAVGLVDDRAGVGPMEPHA